MAYFLSAVALREVAPLIRDTRLPSESVGIETYLLSDEP